MMPAAQVSLGVVSEHEETPATALAVCGLMLLGAAPGWAKGTIQWHGCGPGSPSNLQCGELSVPLDYDDPHGAKITLGFNRLPAQDRAHRVGSLVVNPGGPGGAGSRWSRSRRPARICGIRRCTALRHDRHGPARRRDEHPRSSATPTAFNRLVSLFPRTGRTSTR